jgi:hypothetical protein
MTALAVPQSPPAANFLEQIPQAHQDFVIKLLVEHGV